MMRTFAYVRASSLNDAIRQLGADGACAHSGGTDLVGCLRDGVMSAKTVVSLSGLKELRGMTATVDGGLRIGALTTIAEVAADPIVRQKYAALAEASGVIASPQLRNQGTIGGNLNQRPRCWYFRGDYVCTRKGGDTCYAMDGENQYHAVFGGGACVIVHPSDTAPALVALDASVRTAGPTGERTIPVEKFFVLPEVDVLKETVLEPGEIVTEVVLPAPPAGVKSSYRKVRARQSWDFALVGVALAVSFRPDRRVDRARVVFSGVAPVPWRSAAVEKAITGQRLDARTIGRAAEAAVVGATPLEKNGYKLPMLRGAVEEALGRIGA
ncbi:MAG: xanthine dehydrogenase family protein subunit M [Acidobacteriota bacterium]